MVIRMRTLTYGGITDTYKLTQYYPAKIKTHGSTLRF